MHRGEGFPVAEGGTPRFHVEDGREIAPLVGGGEVRGMGWEVEEWWELIGEAIVCVGVEFGDGLQTLIPLFHIVIQMEPAGFRDVWERPTSLHG